MSLSGSEGIVDNNTIYALGNFTTGIASTVDMIFITNNTITANGTNNGTPTSYDTMGIETVGVHIVSGDALVKYNNITTSGEYTVSVAKNIKDNCGVDTIAHLTCINSTKDDIHHRLEALKNAGIENILALRGDITPENKNKIK